MTALVDFRGYRLLASSLLPIGRGTLQYGSDDVGKVVHNSGGALSAAIGRLGQRLNIKEHTIGGVPGSGCLSGYQRSSPMIAHRPFPPGVASFTLVASLQFTPR